MLYNSLKKNLLFLLQQLSWFKLIRSPDELVRPEDFIGLTRPFTLLAPFAGITAAALAASGAAGALLDPAVIFLAALSAALLNAASNCFNQTCDVKADSINKPARPIPSGRISRNDALKLSAALYLLALLLAASVNSMFLLLAAFAALLTILYSWHTVHLKKYGWAGNLTVAVSRGLLLFVAGWSAVALPDSPAPWFIGTAFGLFLLGASTTKDFADIKGDKAEGVRTLPVIYGAKGAAKRAFPFLVLPFLLFPLGAFFGILPAAASLLAVLSLWGGYAAFAMLKNPKGLSFGMNHPSWLHMYLIMLAAYAGIAVSYWV